MKKLGVLTPEMRIIIKQTLERALEELENSEFGTLDITNKLHRHNLLNVRGPDPMVSMGINTSINLILSTNEYTAKEWENES